MGVWVWVRVGRAGHSDICSLTVKSRCLTLENTQRDHSLLRDVSVVLLFFYIRSVFAWSDSPAAADPGKERSIKERRT